MSKAVWVLGAYVALQLAGRVVAAVGAPPWRRGHLYFLAVIDGVALLWAGVAAFA